MAQSDRHVEIANAIATAIATGVPGIEAYGDVRVESHPYNSQPERGIVVVPMSEREGVGTNESDDIMYSTLVARVAHGLGNDEMHNNSNWRTSVRLLFHRRRLDIDACVLYCNVKYGNIAIPGEWESRNIDKSTLEVICVVRERRTRE
jgi:hypothetical protein